MGKYLAIAAITAVTMIVSDGFSYIADKVSGVFSSQGDQGVSRIGGELGGEGAGAGQGATSRLGEYAEAAILAATQQLMQDGLAAAQQQIWDSLAGDDDGSDEDRDRDGDRQRPRSRTDPDPRRGPVTAYSWFEHQ